MPTYRFRVTDPEKYHQFQLWSYRLHPHLVAQLQQSSDRFPVGHIHGESTDKADDDTLAKHGLAADIVD